MASCENQRRRPRRFVGAASLLLCFLAALALAQAASAAGGRYRLVGGTGFEREQVRRALNASAFNWGLVPAEITIYVAARGVAGGQAVTGQIWLDPRLLDSGRFAWALVQHEYAHQVDDYLLDSAKRQVLLSELGVSSWCYEPAGLLHSAYGCERFASTLAWAYWPSCFNSLRPAGPQSEAGAIAPRRFRALLRSLLGARRCSPAAACWRARAAVSAEPGARR
jgi:hypothetical protein